MARDQDHDPLYGLIASMSQAAPQDGMVKRSLQAIRTHLDMEVAYVSEFVGDQIVFREVDAPGLEAMIKPGDSRSLDEVYCRHILEGRLPELIPDTSTEPLAMAMPITQAVPIGKHVSVPIRMQDGSVYGMFCCLGFKPDHSLHERDMQMMRVFAELAAFELMTVNQSINRRGREAARNNAPGHRRSNPTRQALNLPRRTGVGERSSDRQACGQ